MRTGLNVEGERDGEGMWGIHFHQSDTGTAPQGLVRAGRRLGARGWGRSSAYIRVAARRWKEWDCTCRRSHSGAFLPIWIWVRGSTTQSPAGRVCLLEIGWLDATMRLSSPPLNRPPPSAPAPASFFGTSALDSDGFTPFAGECHRRGGGGGEGATGGVVP